MRIKFIGDIHSVEQKYLGSLWNTSKDSPSIQLGDFGVGFGAERWKVPSHHHFLRGNHDNPALCKTLPNFIEDGVMVYGTVFCVGGAMSVDAHQRTEGVDWWMDEEVDNTTACSIIATYEKLKPDIVASHDCPSAFFDGLVGEDWRWPSLTRDMLNVMYKIHKPKVWVFGHHHKDVSVFDGEGGTHFRCVYNVPVSVDTETFHLAAC